MSGTEWTLTGSSETPGWLEIPTPDSPESARRWVGEQTAAMRAAWGEGWEPAHEGVVPAMLEAALAHRRDQDALAFQLWPTNAAVCLFVHAAVGEVDDEIAAPAEAVPYDSAGLGPGLHVPVARTVAGATVLGAEFVFRSGARVVAVSVEPTLPELLAILLPAVHGFVQSLVLTGPAGRRFRADPPRLPGADPADQWALP